jgi:hypothetical protein
MNTSKRNLMIVAVCVVVLGGVTAALTLTPGAKAGTASSTASTETIELVSKKSEDIVSMSVKNKKGSYTLIPVVTPSSSTSAASGASSAEAASTTYSIKELAGVPIDSSAASQVVQNGFSLVATKNLGAVTNLEEYGLKDPQATVEVSFKDGSTYNYKIGSVCSTDSASYYMCGENSNNVYVVGVDGGILDSVNYFVSKDVLAVTSSSGTNDFTKITLSGKNYAKPVTIQKTDSVTSITAPISTQTDDTKLTALETALATVTATSVEAVNPDAAALKKYGLDTPSAVAEFTVNKGNYKVIAGAQNGDNYYVMLDKGNAVYLVSKDSAGAWVNTSAFALRSKLILMPNIATVKSITVTQGTTPAVLTIARTKDEKTSTEDKPAYTYKVTGTSGKELAYDTNYKKFYESLISLELLEEANTKPSGKPDYTIQYAYYDKSNTDTVEFYKSGDRRYTAVLNGQVCGTVVSTDLEKVSSKLKLLQDGQTVS